LVAAGQTAGVAVSVDPDTLAKPTKQ
jgi:hypothetical protein